MKCSQGLIAIVILCALGTMQRAEATPRPRAPSPAISPTAATAEQPRSLETPPPLKTLTIKDQDFVDGVCYFPSQTAAPSDADATKMESACQTMLFGISGNISVPGLVFVGLAFGKSNHFLVVPAASVGAGLALPIYRPQLECDLTTDEGPRKGQYSCDIPAGVHFVASFIASLNIAFGEMFFPSAGMNGTQAQEFGTRSASLAASSSAWPNTARARPSTSTSWRSTSGLYLVSCPTRRLWAQRESSDFSRVSRFNFDSITVGFRHQIARASRRSSTFALTESVDLSIGRTVVILSICAGCTSAVSHSDASAVGEPPPADAASSTSAANDLTSPDDLRVPDDLGASGVVYDDLAWTDLATSSKDLAQPVTSNPLPPGTTVTGIWGTAADNMYIATNAHVVYHLGTDGVAQAQAVSGGLIGITGSDAQHIWGVTIGNVVFSTGDGNWTDQDDFLDTQFLYVSGIWAAGPNDIYATGIRQGGFGVIYHSTGDGHWTSQLAAGTRMIGVGGSSSTDIYAVGWSSQVFHSIGDGTWTNLTAQFTGSFTSVWGNATDMFIAGTSIYDSHADGAWTLDGHSSVATWDLRGIWGSDGDDVWAVGPGGLLLHRDANGWTPYPSGTTSDLYAVWGVDSAHVWIGGKNFFGQIH